MNPLIAVLMIWVLSSQTWCQEVFWRDRDGNPTPETEAMKSKEGFGGWLVVTPDQDWGEKWNTPSDVIPHFKEASTVAIGQQIMTLIFFANPLVGEDGFVEIRCDLRVTRPDGTISVDLSDQECFKGAIAGDPAAIRLSNSLLGFVGEKNDVRGEWVTNVKLTDVVGRVSLSLRARFDLVDDEA